MHCICLNARSICNKLRELHQLISDDNLAVVGITETWLNSSIPDNLITDCYNYSVYRKDRDDRPGGGVCILVNNNILHSIPVAIPTQYSHIEICAVDVLNLQSKCRIIVVYRPPSADNDIDGFRYCAGLAKCVEHLTSNNHTIVLFGDFNIPKFNDVIQPNSFSCSDIITNLFFNCGLTQFITDPTRFNSCNGTFSLLDLVLSNDSSFITNIAVTDPFSTSDHCIIHFDLLDVFIKNAAHSCKPMCSSYNFNRANWQGVCTWLHQSDIIHTLSQYDNIEDQFNRFYSILYECIDNNVPIVACRNSKRGGVRYPVGIRRKLSHKKLAWRKYKRARSPAALLRYKHVTAECRKAIHDFLERRENSIINSGSLSSFYRHCNKSFTSRSTIGPLRAGDGSYLVDPHSKAALFQRVFADYFTVDDGILPDLPVSTSTPDVDIVFTPAQVGSAIKRLKGKAKGGPDGIPAVFVKRCALWLQAPLAYLFHASYVHSYLPPSWTKAYITPVYKKGDRSDPNNYRPISLTSVLCKLMESVVKNQLMSHLLTHKLISTQQHAFMTNRSTASNLLECALDWSVSLNSKCLVDVIYIDYRRAFDSIVHNKLLLKLGTFGISGKLLDWIGAFLSNRTQRVVIENSISDSTPVTSGIVQGSVLGPILFLLYINDLADIVNLPCKLILFADDSKLFTSFNLSTDNTAYLQHILDLIYQWSNLWQLLINIAKCLCMRLHSARSIVNQPTYSFNNVLLSHSDTVNDLGILTSSDYSFDKHIAAIVTKASQRLGLLFRSFISRDPSFLHRAYITYVRPLLEYNSVVWSPILKKNIDAIEFVQRRFTKRVPTLENMEYLDRLRALNLESLELRRLKADLVYYFKVFHGLTPHTPQDFFLFHNPPSTVRYSETLLVKPRRGNKSLFSLLPYRSVDCWNNLSLETKSATSVQCFKSRLKSLDLQSYLYGTCFTDLAHFHTL